MARGKTILGSFGVCLLLSLVLIGLMVPGARLLLGPHGGPAGRLLALFENGPARAAAALIADGDFEAVGDGDQLRGREQGGWYESRNIGGDKEARLQLKLSTKPIGSNATQKAMIKGDPRYNTYLSQLFSEPQRKRFSLQWDIYVREILAPFNRAAFQMIGSAHAKGRGPNGSGPERFVFLAFENAAQPGKINLFAIEGRNPDQWDERTVLVSGLDLDTWYTVRIDVDVPGKAYTVSVGGATQAPISVAAFRQKKADPPEALTHISFASWDDGPGTFYVDNVRQP
ncbi:MAG: hypothetical protein V1774_09300 [Candidatus Eisenbacteria bacterium]